MDIFEKIVYGHHLLSYEVEFMDSFLPYLQFDMHSAPSPMALSDAKRCLRWRLVSPNY